MELSNKEIGELYEGIKTKWERYLKKEGVILPSLRNKTSYTKDALVLVYLYKNINKKVSKTELTAFIQKFYPKTNDVQQARHLAAQKGWCILSGTRHDFEAAERNLKSGEYMLISLEKIYGGFTQRRRTYTLEGDDTWEKIKKEYGYHCATCGSKEGEPNIHYPSSITHLQKGHMDPKKPLEVNNIIPQCEKCNRPDRNYFVYDKKGRVIKIADPKFVLKSDEKVQIEILKILLRKFKNKVKDLISGLEWFK